MPDISQGEHEARRDAASMLYENDAKVAASILGWGPENILGIQRIISFIREQKSAEDNSADSAGFLVFQIQMMLDHHKPDAGSADEWFPRFLEWLTEFARQMQPVVRSEVVFFALLYAAFEKSLAHVNLKKICNSENVWRELQENERSRRAALASGKQFKLTPSGRAVTEDEDEFHLIPELPITAETAMFEKIITLSHEVPIRTTGEPTRFHDLYAGSAAPQDDAADPIDVQSEPAATATERSLETDPSEALDLPDDDHGGPEDHHGNYAQGTQTRDAIAAGGDDTTLVAETVFAPVEPPLGPVPMTDDDEDEEVDFYAAAGIAPDGSNTLVNENEELEDGSFEDAPDTQGGHFDTIEKDDVRSEAHTGPTHAITSTQPIRPMLMIEDDEDDCDD